MIEQQHPTAIASRFLQTVVIVDDDAYSPTLVEYEPVATLGDEDISFFAAESMLFDPQEQDDLGESTGEFNTEKIVEGFADLGVMCAALRPNSGDRKQEQERFVKIASRADVVVLDWIIRPEKHIDSGAHGPSGSRNSLDLLLSLAKEDAANGSPLRLVCIYTGDAFLDAIFDQLVSALDKEFPGNVLGKEDDNRIDFAGTRIVILAKDRGQEIHGREIVTSSELPLRVLFEFSRFASDGILPRLVLSSLSAVRDQAHKLLRRFDSRLDPSLLGHRATTSPAETEQFVLTLIGDELASIVSSSKVTAPLADSEIDRAVDGYLEGRDTFVVWKTRAASKPTTIAKKVDARNAFTKGIDGKHKIRESSQSPFHKNTSYTSILLPGGTDTVRQEALARDLEFSALSSLSRDRKFDGELLESPELRLGSLIARRRRRSASDAASSVDESTGVPVVTPTPQGRGVGEDLEYYLCLQPICDSVRLTASTKFPFLTLVECLDDSERFDLVAENNGYRAISFEKPKFNQVTSYSFKPNRARSAVCAVWSDDGWVFKGGSKGDFLWLGDVRLDKAHRMISSIVSDAGRVGINEYEYLRRHSS